jgi:hypothetical protein
MKIHKFLVFCAMLFSWQTSFTAEQLTRNKGRSRNDDNIKCFVCKKCDKKIYGGKAKAIRHGMAHYEETDELKYPFKCPVDNCINVYTQADSRKVHIDTVHQELYTDTFVTCKICNIKVLFGKLRSHECKEHPLSLPNCVVLTYYGKDSADSRHAKKNDANIKYFFCKKCKQKLYFGRAKAIRHGMTHYEDTDELKHPFKCPVDNCINVYTQAECRKAHIQKDHQELYENTDTLVTCKICNKKLCFRDFRLHEGKEHPLSLPIWVKPVYNSTELDSETEERTPDSFFSPQFPSSMAYPDIALNQWMLMPTPTMTIFPSSLPSLNFFPTMQNGFFVPPSYLLPPLPPFPSFQEWVLQQEAMSFTQVVANTDMNTEPLNNEEEPSQ